MSPIEFNLPFSDLALLGFYLVALVYIVYSAVLFYHWQEYSVENKVTKITLLSYFTFTLPLMIGLAFLTFYVI